MRSLVALVVCLLLPVLLACASLWIDNAGFEGQPPNGEPGGGGITAYCSSLRKVHAAERAAAEAAERDRLLREGASSGSVRGVSTSGGFGGGFGGGK